MKKILIVAPAWVGDAIMAQPMYARLKQRHPQAQIDVLAPAWTRPLHARMAEIGEAIDAPFGHGELKLRERWKLARELKARGYDQVIVLPNSIKSALVPMLAGIPTRTGWVGEMRYGLLNDIRTLDPIKLPKMVQRFYVLADEKDAPRTTPIPNPELTINASDRDAALRKLGLTTDKPIIAICPGAEYGPAKRWPAVHAAALATQLIADGAQVWLFGSGKDSEICDEIVQLAPHVINLAGKTSLAEAIDLLSLAHVAVCNDSGLMHVAAALGRPLVAVFGSSSPGFTPPLTLKAKIVTLDLECSPCFERVCPLGHMDCLNKLTPDRVMKALKELNKEY
ncbi:lipopolysaccharide heptosyltransferase II [Chitinibacter bivalviorum]|uniref:lipopolysaccharide heptosyltransferase II n=1 Tax=Chitinibacter bivalviorum TaxID=2739434 RepID=A0A7H9BM96_9NEIS|nr:lipopolysaccharide heptosyltransferase II [Chitinibacter bivalviorum]QLG88494.1 lipopolysaccharide heptosyltransferase II [Chitinibacter bivalviorum]